MRKLAEIVRFRFEFKLSYEQIAQLLVALSSFHKVPDIGSSQKHRLTVTGGRRRRRSFEPASPEDTHVSFVLAPPHRDGPVAGESGVSRLNPMGLCGCEWGVP